MRWGWPRERRSPHHRDLRHGRAGQPLHAAVGLPESKTGRPESALEHYRRALAIDPLDQLAIEETVALLRRQGREREAREFLDRAFDRAQGEVTGMNHLAVVALRQGWTADADRVSCAREHDGEVFAVVRLPGDRYPGDDGLTDTADERCYDLQDAYVMDGWALPATSPGWADRRKAALPTSGPGRHTPDGRR